MRNVDWSPRDPRDFVEDKLTVTITLMEYRELVSKAALYDVMYESERGAERLEVVAGVAPLRVAVSAPVVGRRRVPVLQLPVERVVDDQAIPAAQLDSLLLSHISSIVVLVVSELV